jgi:succinate dehydrogenase / fumarate reductase iron-sulfur subunit
MNVTLEIQRFNPKTDDKPYVQSYDLDVEGTDRVLDALIEIKRNIDGTLGFRRSCAHGVCGSDAMRINGKDGLACKTLIQEVIENDGDTIRIEPMRHLPIERDLMVDQSTFFEKYRSVKPFFMAAKTVDEKEIPQSQKERAAFDDPTKCILCGACYSACPVLDKNPDFLGPAAIVQASRFVFDSRDAGLEPRLDVLDEPNGVWPCENHFECTKACPRDIKVTKLINLTKREIKRHRDDAGESVNDGGQA